MKKRALFTGMIIVATAITLQAQTTDDLLRDFAQKVAKAPAVEIEFIWNETVPGTMVLQGGMFTLKMDEFYVFCNGEKKWYYNQGIDQWEEMPHDKNSPDILENPSAFFSRLNQDYYHAGNPLRKESTTGNPVWELTLVPNSIESPFTYVIIALAADGLKPLYIRYALADGTQYPVEISSFKTVPARPAGYFLPDFSR
ncbi:MAG TPA: outer membrane lipoprotein carrier protein LolA [Bacteroidales bacterium]|nr:outer membrane lipoprotein carrier protein LolA [Bacteroidales bacterium]